MRWLFLFMDTRSDLLKLTFTYYLIRFFLNYKVSKIHSSGDVLFMAYTSGFQRFSVPYHQAEKRKHAYPFVSLEKDYWDIFIDNLVRILNCRTPWDFSRTPVWEPLVYTIKLDCHILFTHAFSALQSVCFGGTYIGWSKQHKH